MHLRLAALAGAAVAAGAAAAVFPTTLGSSQVAVADNSPFGVAFDCAARNLALEMAFRLQPERPASFFTELADALNGTPEKPTNCTVQVPAAIARATSSTRRRTRTVTREYLRSRSLRDGLTVYVDPVHGSDTNSGAEDAPLKTIPAALALTRTASGFDTIVLRAGTHTPGQTMVLTEADSGLEFLAYPGEEVWISGGVPLTASSGLDWQPYNVNPSQSWQLYNDTTTIFGDAPGPGGSQPGVPFLGWLLNSTACQAACIATAGCTAFTWHDANQGGYAHACYGRTDGVWSPQAESGHFSGHLSTGPNIWVAQLPASLLSLLPNGVLGMRDSGVRLQRARYPNWNSEISFGPSFQAGWTKQQAPALPDVQIDLSTPERNVTPAMFHHFTAGIGGTCARFQPAAGYWCSTNVQGGGSVIYAVPIAMNVTTAQLPHTPYANARGGIIMTWRPGHWASWMAEIGDWTFDAATGASNFSIAAGLFQGSRGADTGDEVYVENIFEELDAAGEWFYNASTNSLYLFPNVTLTPGQKPSPPPSDGSLSLVSLKHLFNVTGSSMGAPVADVAFYGIGFRDTALTYMDPHGIPSGGDWTLERSAVVFAENVVGLTVSGCVFERVDGNALLISGYARNTSIMHNEFGWTGASAIAQWGKTQGGDPRLPDGYGIDGSNGEQPRGTFVGYNYAHELGIWQKQSSFYTQFKSSENVIHGNVVTNGPRAHINFDDGFRGGSVVSGNVLLNSCRESADHGPFNSWDRQRYTWDLPDGTVGNMIKMPDVIAHNLVFANYFSLSSVDNDDGSFAYNITGNVQLYGDGGLKNDFEGAAGYATRNIFSFVRFGASNGYSSMIGTPGTAPYQYPQYADHFVNNTVYQTADNSWGYANAICNGDSATIVGENTVFTPSGNVTECGMPLAQWQAQGHDLGTVVRPASEADPNAFIALARSLLAEAVPELAAPLRS